MTPQHAFTALLAEKLPGYRSTFEHACSALFGGGAAVTLEYEDDDDAGAVARPAAAAAATAAGPAGPTAAAPSAATQTTAAVARGAAPPVPSPDDVDTAATTADPPDPARVRLEVADALRTIATDFARTFNERLSERAQLDPVAGALAPRYEFGAEHVADLVEALSKVLVPLFTRLDGGDLDGARRAAIDAWRPLERRIQEKWQAYFVLTFQDVSVEIKAERDRRRLQAPRVDIAAVEAMASTQAARLSLSDFAAPPEPPRRAIAPWLAVLFLLVIAAVGGWLLARGISATHPASVGGQR